MRIEQPLFEATFAVRENRFRARVRLGRQEVAAYVPNSGRLTELLSPHRPVLLAAAQSAGRVTGYDLLMVSLPHTLVSIDARLPNQLLYEALQNKAVPEFGGYRAVRQEVAYGDSRLDFLLEADGFKRPCLIETKSVTLVRDGIGYFPDAVTTGGRRPVLELRRACIDGMRAAVVFVIQREDVVALAPHDESDPRFGEAVREVVADGVEVYAYCCRVTRGEVSLHKRVPVLLTKENRGQAIGPSWTSAD